MGQRLIRQSQIRGTGEFSTLEAQLNFMITTSSSYVYNQATPSDTWVITHSLNKIPKVTVVNEEGEIIYASVTYDSNDQVTIRFSEPITGQAFLQYVRTYNYTHVQETPAVTWTVQHNLNRIVEVTAVDGLGNVVYPNIQYQSPDTVLVTFSVPTTGIVYVH